MNLKDTTLLAVANLGQEAHTAAIYHEVVRLTGKDVALAAIHVELGGMEAQGLVQSQYSEQTYPERGNRRRLYYWLKGAGRRRADELKASAK